MVKDLVAVEILKAIEGKPRITPLEIAAITGLRPQYIRNSLGLLMELTLVITPFRGVYEITTLGKYVLKNMPTKKARTCPTCGQTFKPMTIALWEVNLYQHLRIRHNLSEDEANKIIQREMGQS